jgi:NAD(P)-dependent dehydrogenase (short-subunit alcohol dehydrogenase family)
MPNFHALSSALTFQSTNVVVIGGTQGIGSGIAVRFAELGASVLVVGRNEALGNEIVKTLEKAAEKNGRVDGRVRFGFARRDLGSVEQIRAAAEDIARWAGDGGICFKAKASLFNFCVYDIALTGRVSAGFLPLTAQSMATGFNVQILSAFSYSLYAVNTPSP